MAKGSWSNDWTRETVTKASYNAKDFYAAWHEQFASDMPHITWDRLPVETQGKGYDAMTAFLKTAKGVW